MGKYSISALSRSRTDLHEQFLDTSTEFVFGRTRDSLHHPEREDVMLAMVDIMRGARVRLTMGAFMFLHRDPQWYSSIGVVHRFMDE